MHLYEFIPSTQAELCIHMWSLHSSISISHFSPVNPLMQLQENPLTKSTHVALLSHGANKQSSMFTSQFPPLKPTAQSHKKSFT